MMFGFATWFFVSIVLSLLAILAPLFLASQRPWIQRVLLILGGLSAVWGFIPVFGNNGIQPILVLSSTIAFSAIATIDKIS